MSFMSFGFQRSRALCGALATFVALSGPTSCSDPAELALEAKRRAQPVVTAISVERIDSGGTYRVDWTVDPAVPVRIDVTDHPHNEAGWTDTIATGVQAAPYFWTPPSRDKRFYFTLSPDGGHYRHAATRVLELEGGRNFRDLGGYSTVTGETVKWGTLFRSGSMHKLTPKDQRFLSGLGIKIICDLRTAQERIGEPTKLPESQFDIIHFADQGAGDYDELLSTLANPDTDGNTMKMVMQSIYRKILFQQREAFSEMFERLSSNDLPLVFHCSAGKDRTGVAAALVLAALQVPEETIVADYALSDQVVDYRTELGIGASSGKGDSHPLSAVPTDVISALLSSDPSYIEVALAEAKAKHGSVLHFIQVEYGVSDRELAAIRANLLDPENDPD